MYPILEVYSYDQTEQLGTKTKHWFVDENDVDFLFKAGRKGTGENWAEKASSELAKRIGIPCAHYDLARWKDLDGVVTPGFIPEQGHLELGNEVLAHVVTGYDPGEEYEAREYRLSTVCDILKNSHNIRPPIGADQIVATLSPLSVFIGYLVFDCWIGNPDRHHENWGFVVTRDAKHLSPTFDHASGLGARLLDEQRRRRLVTKDRGFSVESWVIKARTPFRDASGVKLYTLDVVRELRQRYPESVDFWLDQLATFELEDIEMMFSEFPESHISPVAIAFALRILKENRKRMEALR
ncbi:MAG: HipA domain-containing protein [Candidatus Hydrogenedentes bacterium]|nr:HipA domain-containing protein [Candidatus Hydrogenedentota bacterium]